MDAPTLAAEISDRRPPGIAAAISRLISSGALEPGSRLPTVRSLATALAVSPTTVSEAWSTLTTVGAIEARGRACTLVRSPAGSAVPRRYGEVTGGSGQFALDLSSGTPDPDLLPDLSGALTEVAGRSLTTNYLDDPVLPDLAFTLRSQWPFSPEALTVVDGALDALDRLITIAVPYGARVLVENPAFPPLLDRLDVAGAEVVPLELDVDGVTPDSLRAGLAADPVAVFTQPRAHNPTGISMTSERCAALASILRDTGALVIEDDHAAGVATSPVVSIGEHLPKHTIRVLSFSK